MMKIVGRYQAFSLLCLGIVLGCGRPPQSSDLSHNIGQPTPKDAESWMWEILSEQRLEEDFLARLGYGPGVLLPESDELTRRLNQWVTYFDTVIRTAHPSQLANVPIPKLRVVSDPKLSAYLATVGVCYTVRTKADVRPTFGGGYQHSSSAHLSFPLGSIDYLSGDAYDCKGDDSAIARLSTTLEYFNRNSPTCGFLLKNDEQGNPVLTPDPRCYETPAFSQEVEFSEAVIFHPTDTIVVSSGLIASMQREEELVGVIAHELGHFYAADVLTLPNALNFYYQYSESNPLSKPTEELQLSELGQKANTVSRFFDRLDDVLSLPYQQIRPELHLATASYAADRCVGGECNPECGVLAQAIDDNEFVHKLSRYPFGPGTPDEAAFRSYEMLVKECFSSIEGSPAELRAEWRKIERFVRRPTWPEWFTGVNDPSRKSHFERLLAQFYEVIESAEFPRSAKNLWQVLESANQHIETKYKMLAGVLEETHSKQVGYYTAEQEADERAVEYMLMGGLNPQALIGATFTVMKYGAPINRIQGFDYGYEKCYDLYKRNWRDESGMKVNIPLGNYHNFHHGNCFRISHLEREIAALNTMDWSDSMNDIPQRSEPWGYVRTRARQLGDLTIVRSK